MTAFRNTLRKLLPPRGQERAMLSDAPMLSAIGDVRRRSSSDQLVCGDPALLGLIAGSGSFPLEFVNGAVANGRKVVAVCLTGEADPALEEVVEKSVWIKVGEFGKLISTFVEVGVKEVALAGGVSRIKLFGGVKLDARGAALIARLRSAKDDVIMRGVADELSQEGIEVIACTKYMQGSLVCEGVSTKSEPTEEEYTDIQVGVAAIQAMSNQDIGQLVVVREGVIVAVEAVEGTDRTILRGGNLGGKGTVVVKFAKPTQDMRFDVPVVGKRTIETMIEAKVRVLALEAGRCLMMEREEALRLSNKHRISVIGCAPLVK